LTEASNGQWKLYSPTNQQIDFGGIGSELEVSIPVDGIYTLIVESNTNDSLDYSFRTYQSQSIETQIDLGTIVSGTVLQPGDERVYTFQGQAGQQIYYDALDSTDLNLRKTLVSPSGSSLFANDYLERDRSLLTLTESGTYRFIVRGNDRATGNYQFQLLDAAENPPLQVGDVVDGSIDRPGETQLFQFEGTAGQQLAVALSSDRVFGTAAEADTLVDNLFAWYAADGYAGIDRVLDLEFRPDAAKNIVLITFDDRQIQDQSLDFTTISNRLSEANVRLNFIGVPGYTNENGDFTLGVNADGTAYIYQAGIPGGYGETPGGQILPRNPFYPLYEEENYVALAWENGGSSWDIDKIYTGGLLGRSLTSALIDEMAEQTGEQLGIELPEPTVATPTGENSRLDYLPLTPERIDLDLPEGETVDRTISVTLPAQTLEGRASGGFGGPLTPESTSVWAVSSEEGGTNNRIEWGQGNEGVLRNPSQSNYIQFDGAEFTATTEESFPLGTLSYRNGNVYPWSAFDGDFTFDLALVADETATTLQTVEFDFNILNTPNNTGDPVLDGDRLRFSASNPTQAFTFKGIDYQLELVGFSDDGGQTIISEFNAPEQTTAQATLYAKMTPLPTEVNLVGAEGVFENLSGEVADVLPGDELTFDGRFFADGETHRFPLSVVSTRTGAIIGQIPVSINDEYRYSVRAVDADGDELTYRKTSKAHRF
jgi:hypothetical protein